MALHAPGHLSTPLLPLNRPPPPARPSFVFAIVLGAGIEEVKGRLAAVRAGEVGLRLQGHVLVLNW